MKTRLLLPALAATTAAHAQMLVGVNMDNNAGLGTPLPSAPYTVSLSSISGTTINANLNDVSFSAGSRFTGVNQAGFYRFTASPTYTIPTTQAVSNNYIEFTLSA